MILDLMDNNPLEGERKNIRIRIKKIDIFQEFTTWKESSHVQKRYKSLHGRY